MPLVLLDTKYSLGHFRNAPPGYLPGYGTEKQEALLLQRDRARHLSVEILQLQNHVLIDAVLSIAPDL